MGSSLYWYGTLLVPGDTGQLDHGRDADGDGVLPAADGGQLNPGTPAAGARAIHTDRQGQGVGACASDRGRGLSAPPFPPALSCPSQLRDGDGAEALREPDFLLLVCGGAGWDG